MITVRSQDPYRGQTVLFLPDGFTPVPVEPSRGDVIVRAVRWIGGEWRWWVSFVYCGPAAPLPARAGVGRGKSVDQMITDELRGEA